MEWIKNVFVDMFCDMDWKQFIPSLIATIVGIFGPFFIQKRHEKKNRREDALRLLKSVKDELEGITKTLQELASDETYMSPVKTPVWDGLLNSNEVIMLSELQNYKKNSKNENWYKMIFSIYEKISEYNQWWNLYTDKYFSGISDSELVAVTACIETLRDTLCSPDNNENDSIYHLIAILEKCISLNDKKAKRKIKRKK